MYSTKLSEQKVKDDMDMTKEMTSHKEKVHYVIIVETSRNTGLSQFFYVEFNAVIHQVFWL